MEWLVCNWNLFYLFIVQRVYMLRNKKEKGCTILENLDMTLESSLGYRCGRFKKTYNSKHVGFLMKYAIEYFKQVVFLQKMTIRALFDRENEH